MAAILNFRWPAYFFKKVTPKGYLRQVWCLYHILKDSPEKKKTFICCTIW